MELRKSCTVIRHSSAMANNVNIQIFLYIFVKFSLIPKNYSFRCEYILQLNDFLSIGAKYIKVSDTCGQVIHDEARKIQNQKYQKKVSRVTNVES